MRGAFPETLYDEFITVQRLDPYFENKEHRLDDEFYTEDYIKFLEEEGREEAILSEEELEADEIEEGKVNSFIIDLQEEVMKRIVDYLDVYGEIYRVPPIQISNQEWDNFFNQTFQYYENHDSLRCYDEDMITLNRLAISRALLYEKNALEIDDYIDSIEYLDSEVLLPNNKEELRKQVKEGFQQDRIIPIQKYLRKSKR